jgi:hypothetical protein
MWPTIMFMNGAGGNTGGAGSTGASNTQTGPYNPNTAQTGPSNPNTTQTGPSNPNPTQAGPSNRQRANYSSGDGDASTQTKEVLKNREYRDTVDELLRFERENPKLITNTRKGIHPTKVTLSQAKKRMIAYKKDLGLD